MSVIKMFGICILVMLLGGCYEPEAGSKAQVLGIEQHDEVWGGCPPQEQLFQQMRTGDVCDFSHGCGYVEEIPSRLEEIRLTRDALCIEKRLSMKDTWLLDEEAPRPEVEWQDCAALAGGRTGERCNGSFSCFEKMGDTCLETVICSEFPDTEMRGKLLRFRLCDDVGNHDGSLFTTGVYTNCENTTDPLPLDKCDGNFLCVKDNIDPTFTAAPSCGDESDYCLMGEGSIGDGDIHDLVWCDGDTLHLFYINNTWLVSFHVGRIF